MSPSLSCNAIRVPSQDNDGIEKKGAETRLTKYGGLAAPSLKILTSATSPFTSVYAAKSLACDTATPTVLGSRIVLRRFPLATSQTPPEEQSFPLTTLLPSSV